MSDVVLDLTADQETLPRLAPHLPPRAEVIELAEIKRWGMWRALPMLRRRSGDSCVTIVNEFRKPRRWIGFQLLALMPRTTQHQLMDRNGRTRDVSWPALLFLELPFVIRRALTERRVSRRARRSVRRLRELASSRVVKPKQVLYSRTDLGPRLTLGGSLAHIRGVVSGFVERGCAVELVSPAEVDGLELLAATTLVPADPRYDVSVELPHLAYNFKVLPQLLERIARTGAELIYHRHGLGSFAAAEAARIAGLPLVVEYNGPEVWIADHWGAAKRHLGLFAEIERRVLRAADLVVAVSAALRPGLLDAGVADARILVNPNGVDPARFDPERLSERRAALRARFGVAPDEVIAGFVGTFGPWHGAEVLAAAIAGLPATFSRRMRFLFVGDGPRRPAVLSFLDREGGIEQSIFTGPVAFDAIPDLLAACDLCLAPHTANRDGSVFFGSPTKLFEYLASGRAVIASDLGQIGEIVEHDRNGWLVPPGDVPALSAAIMRLAADAALRERLGREGRQRAVRDHSWTAHVERILSRLARKPLDDR